MIQVVAGFMLFVASFHLAVCAYLIWEIRKLSQDKATPKSKPDMKPRSVSFFKMKEKPKVKVNDESKAWAIENDAIID